MKYKQFMVGLLLTNCYILTDESTGKIAVIDPGAAEKSVTDELENSGLENIEYILLTHGHFDHIGGVEELRKLTGAKVAVFGDDAQMMKDPVLNGSIGFGFPAQKCTDADIILSDGDIIKLGASEIRVISSPGHTSGGCCYYCEDMLFSGDTLFYEGCGRCDMATADASQMRKSLKKLVETLPQETRVFPGHGCETSIEHEAKMNPYIN